MQQQGRRWNTIIFMTLLLFLLRKCCAGVFMPVVNITEDFVAHVALPESGRVYYSDEKLPGFSLCVSAAGSKVFYRVGRVNGQPTRVKLEAYPKVNVKTARQLWAVVNADIATGKPARTVKPRKKTLGDIWEWHLKHNLKPGKRNWQKIERRWNNHLAHWAKKPLDQIKRVDVKELQTAIAEGGIIDGKRWGGKYASNEVMDLLRTLFDVAIDNEDHDANPTLRIRKYQQVERARYLQAEELPAFFNALDSLSPTFADAMRIALFTGARRANVFSMRWDEINFESERWMIPGEKNKSKRLITLPLSEVALAILLKRKLDQQQAGQVTGWVFPSRVRGKTHVKWPKYALNKLREVAELKDFRMHDLRRTLGSWQANDNESELTISKSLGQTSTAATKVYARLHLDTVRRAIENAVAAISAAGKKEIPKKV